MKILFLTLFLAISLSFGISPANAQIEQCLGEKTTTLPLAGDYGAFGQFSVTRQVIANPDPDAPAPISVFIPGNATAQNKVPVVFFAHGYGGISYQFYEGLLRQLASSGYAVVFAPYATSIAVNHTTRYNQLWNGFLTAAGRNAAIFDTTRVGFAGHSYGGGATPEMARRGAAQGWGANGLFLFIMAPWYNWGTNMNQIPGNAKMIVQVYWDDESNQHLIAQNDHWNRLPQIAERRWQVIRASKTYCSLNAGHSVPTTNRVEQTDGVMNGYDAWGVWRRIHALAAYTFSGNQAAKNVAFGVDARMGNWRGIFASRRIAPIETTDFPVLNSEVTPFFLWSERCSYAQGLPCP